MITTAKKFDKVSGIYNTLIFQFIYFYIIHPLSFWFIKKNIKENYKILDIACGTGIFLKKIQNKYKNLQCFGIDNSEKMIGVAKKNENIQFLVAEADKIPFQNNSFDFVTIIDAFYYFPDKNKAIQECSRVLKQNGYLFIHSPAIDIFPNFLIYQIKLISKFLFFDLEDCSSFLKIKELKKIAEINHFKEIRRKNILLNRLFLFQKI